MNFLRTKPLPKKKPHPLSGDGAFYMSGASDLKKRPVISRQKLLGFVVGF
jgi:hypothetical protein